MAGLAVISILPKKTDDEVSWFEFANYPAYFAVILFISIAGLALLYCIDRLKRKGRTYMTSALISTIVCCVVCTASGGFFWGPPGGPGKIKRPRSGKKPTGGL